MENHWKFFIVYKFKKIHILLTVSAKDLGGLYEEEPEIIP